MTEARSGPVSASARFELDALDRLPAAAYDELARLAAAVTRVEMAVLVLFDGARCWVKGSLGLDRALRGVVVKSLASWFRHTGAEPLVVADTLEDARFRDDPLVTGEPRARSLAVAPFHGHGGTVLGALAVLDRAPRTPIDLDPLQLVARQVARLGFLQGEATLALETSSRLEVSAEELQARLLAVDEEFAVRREVEDRKREERLVAQYALSRLLADSASFEAAAPKLLEVLAASGSWDLVAIIEAEDVLLRLRPAATGSFGREVPGALEYLQSIRLERGVGIAGRVWATGETIWVEDLAAYPDPSVVATAERLGARSMLAVPVVVEGRMVGIVDLFAQAVRPLEEDTRALTQALASQIGLFLQRKREAVIQGRLLSVLEMTSDLVLVADGSGKLLYMNGAARALLEIPLEVDVRSVQILDYLPEATKALLLGEIRAAAGREGRWAGEIVFRSRSGREVPVSHVVVFGREADGQVVTYSSISRDITETKKVERMKNEFVSTVSHELRTPLTSIRGSLGLLEAGVVGEVPEAAREMVHIARINSERLIRLVNDMLDLDKMDAGQLSMDLRELDAADVGAAALGAVRGFAAESSIALSSAVGIGLRVRADFDRLVQVLTNLLSNAVKFAPPGSAVTLAAARRGDRVRFEVRDQGPGITASMQAHLFRRFQQLDSSDARSKGGTGLGLAISKAIVERLGGDIGVESAPELRRGSTFWVELPGI